MSEGDEAQLEMIKNRSSMAADEPAGAGTSGAVAAAAAAAQEESKQ